MSHKVQRLAFTSSTLAGKRMFSTNTPKTQSKMYDNKIFASVANTSNGEVGSETQFHYHQDKEIVWAEYHGGSIVRGTIMGKVLDDAGKLDMRYQHMNTTGELMTGQCLTTPEVLEDGRLRLHEKWQWTSGERSKGESTVEELKK